jgi:hypothetical protein
MTRTPLGLFLSLGVLTGIGTANDDVGVNIEFYREAYQQAEAIDAAGIRWVRVDLAWSAAETAPGRYDFAIWDRLLEAFEPRGIRVLFVLDYGNEIYEGGFPPATDSGRAAFAAYAGAAARHSEGARSGRSGTSPTCRSIGPALPTRRHTSLSPAPRLRRSVARIPGPGSWGRLSAETLSIYRASRPRSRWDSSRWSTRSRFIPTARPIPRLRRAFTKTYAAS